jgi:hypothetical protein
LHIADATKEETYRSHPIFREFIDKGGIRSSLIVAMRKGRCHARRYHRLSSGGAAILGKADRTAAKLGPSVRTASAQNAAPRSIPPHPKPTRNPMALGSGGIDQRAEFGPRARQIWCRSALPWSMNISSVGRAERG